MSAFGNVRLGTKLISGFSLVAVLAMLMAVIGYGSMSSMQKNYNELYKDRLLPIQRLDAANAAAEKIRGDLHRFILLPDQRAKMERSIAEQNETINKLMAEYRAGRFGLAEKDELTKFDAAWAAYQQAVADDLKQVNAGNQKAAIESISPGGATLAARSAVEQSVHRLIQVNRGEGDKLNRTIDAAGTRSRWIFSGGSVFIVLLSLAIGILLSRSTTRLLNRVIAGLGEGAQQVGSASAQVSSASQSLAEGTSEQAAGLEETSSSIEEMTSMTRQNADNANQANTLMAETSGVVEDANRSMTELTGSMKEISHASEETAKIIKTIDEIAFQTNLLALNAAVEAARAGEAGAGFAVVAGEVRNLAMRAAEAAKNTANLIEGTVKKIKTGSDIVSKTNEAFGKVAGGSKKVGELVKEIAAASHEQAQGIEQINKAVAEMDKVVQKNAASAEESASASKEMNAQAEQMKGFVGDLVAIVEGNGKRNGATQGMAQLSDEAFSDKPAGIGQQLRSGVRKVLKAPATQKKQENKGDGKEAAVLKSKGVKPDQVIPLGEGNFKEF